MSWQKASFCGGGGNNCIELNATPRHIHLRESTAPATTVTTTPDRLRDLLREIKAGRYDQPPRGGRA
jgi:hypothetical protein